MAENRYEGVSEACLEAIPDVPGLESALLQLIRKLTQDLHEAVNRNREDLNELLRDVDKLFQDFREAVNRNREDLERLIRGQSEPELRPEELQRKPVRPDSILPHLGNDPRVDKPLGARPIPETEPEAGVNNPVPKL